MQHLSRLPTALCPFLLHLHRSRSSCVFFLVSSKHRHAARLAGRTGRLVMRICRHWSGLETLLRDATRVGMIGSSRLSRGGLEGHVGRTGRRSSIVRSWVGWRSCSRLELPRRGRDAIAIRSQSVVVVMLWRAWWWFCLRFGVSRWARSLDDLGVLVADWLVGVGCPCLVDCYAPATNGSAQ